MYKYCYIFSLLIFDIYFVINRHSFTSLCSKFKYDWFFVNWSLAMLCHPHHDIPSRLHFLFRGSSVDNKPEKHQTTVVTLAVNCIQTTSSVYQNTSAK